MKEINLKGLDQNVYFETLPNGLEVYLVPYNNKTNYAMHYGTKYGSINIEFKTNNETEFKKVPLGIAHFLEHKLFEEEDNNENPFSFAAKTGTDCNAFTDFKETEYLFEGSKGFEENLEYLINFVSTPYFTEENVAKEKGIIIEELKQYSDQIEWEMEDIIRSNTFSIDPIRYDIGGTIDSVNSITKEDLYYCYNTFYQPSNMFIVITGNFDKEKALEIIKNNKILKEKQTNNEIINKEINEPLKVNKEYEEIKRNIEKEKLGYAIKIPIDKEYDRYKYILYIDMIFSILFESSSILREKLRIENKVTSYNIDILIASDYLVPTIMIETEYKDYVINEINKTLENINIELKDIERIKKVWIATSIKSIDNIYSTMSRITTDIVEYNEIIPNKIDIYKSLNKEELDKIIKNIDFTNKTILVAIPKE